MSGAALRAAAALARLLPLAASVAAGAGAGSPACEGGGDAALAPLWGASAEGLPEDSNVLSLLQRSRHLEVNKLGDQAEMAQKSAVDAEAGDRAAQRLARALHTLQQAAQRSTHNSSTSARIAESMAKARAILSESRSPQEQELLAVPRRASAPEAPRQALVQLEAEYSPNSSADDWIGWPWADPDYPHYPWDPLLDSDNQLDASNYLEDFINASDAVQELKSYYFPNETVNVRDCENESDSTDTGTGALTAALQMASLAPPPGAAAPWPEALAAEAEASDGADDGLAALSDEFGAAGPGASGGAGEGLEASDEVEDILRELEARAPDGAAAGLEALAAPEEASGGAGDGPGASEEVGDILRELEEPAAPALPTEQAGRGAYPASSGSPGGQSPRNSVPKDREMDRQVPDVQILDGQGPDVQSLDSRVDSLTARVETLIDQMSRRAQ